MVNGSDPELGCTEGTVRRDATPHHDAASSTELQL